MQPAGTQIRGSRGSRPRLSGTLARGFLSTLLLVFLLVASLPCDAFFKCCCPCSPAEAVAGSRVVAPDSCCKASTGTTLSGFLPIEPQRSLTPPPILLTESPDLSEILLLPELSRLSPNAVRLHDPPPLILLLCTLLN